MIDAIVFSVHLFCCRSSIAVYSFLGSWRSVYFSEGGLVDERISVVNKWLRSVDLYEDNGM